MILRELFLKLGLDVDTQSFAKGELLASSVKLALSAVAGVAHRVAETVKDAIEYGDKLDESAQAVGMSTQALQEFHYAASLAGVGADEFNGAMMKLSRSMAAAREGSEESAKAYARLGVRVTDGSGKLRKTEDVVMDLEAAFKKLPNGPERVALAMDIFGRSGARLIPMLNGVNPSLAELRDEARELGLVMDADAVQASARLNDNLDRMKALTVGLWRGAIAPVLPTLNELVQKFIAWRKENAAVMRQTISKWIGTIIEAVKTLAITIIGLYKGASFAFTMLVGFVRDTLKIFDDLAGRLAGPIKWVVFGALAFMFSPLLAVGALIAGVLLLIDDYRGYLAGEDSLIGRWKDVINEWMQPNAQDSWFVLQIKSAVNALKEAVKLVQDLTQGWRDALDMWELSKKSNFGFSVDKLSTDDLLRWDAILKRKGQREKGHTLGGEEERGFFDPSVIQKAAAARVASAGVGAGGASYAPQVNMSIYPAPGMSEEDIARHAVRAFDELWGTKWEEAASGTKR